MCGVREETTAGCSKLTARDDVAASAALQAASAALQAASAALQAASAALQAAAR
jgi:hypothetical protein